MEKHHEISHANETICNILQTKVEGSNVIPALCIIRHKVITRANVLAMPWQHWPPQDSSILCWIQDTLAPLSPTEVLWAGGVTVERSHWTATSPCACSGIRSPLLLVMPSRPKVGREDQLEANGMSPGAPTDLPFPGAPRAAFQSPPFSYGCEKPKAVSSPFWDTSQN